jgi:hypothetical protein
LPYGLVSGPHETIMHQSGAVARIWLYDRQVDLTPVQTSRPSAAKGLSRPAGAGLAGVGICGYCPGFPGLRPMESNTPARSSRNSKSCIWRRGCGSADLSRAEPGIHEGDAGYWMPSNRDIAECLILTKSAIACHWFLSLVYWFPSRDCQGAVAAPRRFGRAQLCLTWVGVFGGIVKEQNRRAEQCRRRLALR